MSAFQGWQYTTCKKYAYVLQEERIHLARRREISCKA